MKITRLRLAGFGPFRGEQVVDFDRFDDDGIFLITGKTGAGKSSILDAICYAIYDTVPRYDKTATHLRSDYCAPGDPTFVELEFTLGDDLYRVHRTPKFDRPKQRGDGTTTAQPTAELAIRDGDEWRVFAARPVDVAHEIARILPIRAEQFLQVILLAQNRFQQFLLARTDDRRAVLRTLFGTARFEQLEKSLAERNRALTQQVGGVHDQIDRIAMTADGVASEGDALVEDRAPDVGSPDWFEGLLTRLTRRRDNAAAEAKQATARLAAATLAARSAEDVRARQERRMAASGRLSTLEAGADAIIGCRSQLGAAARALRVWPFIEAQRAARSELTAAEHAEAHAMSAWRLHDHSGVPTIAQLREIIEDLIADRGSLSDVLDAEAGLPKLERQASQLEITVLDAETRVEQHRTRLSAIPAELDELTTLTTATAAAAAALEPARALKSRVSTAVDAARLAERLEAHLEGALLTRKQASSQNAAAAAAYDDLLDRRLTGHAVELANALVKGSPCKVCGATSHPSPAQSDAAPVTEADVEAAAAARIRGQNELTAADAEAHRITVELERSRGMAGGSALDALLVDLADATGQVQQAKDAVRTLADLESRRVRLGTERDTAVEFAADLARELNTARLTLAEHNAAISTITTRIAAQLAGHASIRDRMSSLDIRLDAARSLDASLDRTYDGRTALNTATTTVDALLSELDFEDAPSVESSRRTAAEITNLELRIRDHDDGMAAARSTLAEHDLQNLPSEAVDLEPTRAAFEAANAHRDAASSAAHRLDANHAQLVGLVCDATALVVASVDLIDEQKRVRQLAELVEGKGSNTRRIRLETYVLAARLEQIIVAANLRLDTMTSGRYSLELDDRRQHFNAETGLGLSIRDAHTGSTRATHSLSGGETFLASLALALGLAEVVSNQAGGIALDTLFVDEGFGSLDSETLDIAMSTLDSLRAGGRTVGLISHVESMKEQIPAKLRIVASPSGGSYIDYPMDAMDT